MSKLEQLINELCPDGVEYRPLKELFDLKNGYTPSKAKEEYWKNGTIPWFRMEDLRLNGNILSYAIQKVNSKGIKGKLFPKNSIIMATTATIGEHALILTDYICNQQFTSFTVKEEIKKMFDIKFIFYYFFLLDNQAKQSVNTSSFPSVQMNELKKLLIPLPPLPVQEEIVRILDTFTELTAELTTELTLRKKQYEYYREKLLTFGDEVPHLPMGNEKLGIFIRGGSFQKKDFLEEGIGCIHYGQIFTYYKTYANETKTFINEELARKCRKAQNGNLIIATTSENDEDVCKAVTWLGNEEIAISSDACIYKHHMNPKYVSYFFQTEQFQSQKRQYITGTKVRRVNADNLAKILIPIPPIEEQERIVDILDKFDTLTNSISEGLPYEIELRKKQYEYYRDKLLTFKKLEKID